MKKLMIALCATLGLTALVNATECGECTKTNTIYVLGNEICNVVSNVVETNDTYVYNMTVSLKVPMVKYHKKYGTYTEYQSRTLKGYLYLDYLTETKTVETIRPFQGTVETNVVVTYVKPDLYLYDNKTKEEVPFEVDGDLSQFTIMGKDYKSVSASFCAENSKVTEEIAGVQSLTFCGSGSTKDFTVKVPSCSVCGYTTLVNGKCRRINSMSGNVVGLFSTGCGDESTTFVSTECGHSLTDNRAINGCFGTWKATFKEAISND